MKRKFVLSAIVLALLTISLATLMLLNEFQQAPPSPNPPVPHFIPGAQNVTGTDEGTEAIQIALNNSEAKKWTDKGYQLYGVFQYDSIYWVGILTNEQQLPWVVGITLIVPVQFNSSDPIMLNFELTLANLTENQKEQTLRLSSDTIKTYNGTADLNDVSVSQWDVGSAFYAYPCVKFRVPEDFRKPGVDVYVYVDLENGKVENVFSTFSRPIP